MEWQTEQLEAYLSIEKDGEPILCQRFSISASEATGSDARWHILHRAGCDYEDIRCVKHSSTWFLLSRPEPSEEFRFRRPAFPGIEYRILLRNDFSASRIRIEPGYGSDPEGNPSNFPAFLKRLEENRYDDLDLCFCKRPHALLPAINQVTRIHYLALFECLCAKEWALLSREIGRMEELRGLCLRGSGAGVLDSTAVEEFSKLKNLESLAVGNGFEVAADALPKLATLKNLKALQLDLFGNCDIGPVRRDALAAALTSLQELKELEILILNLSPRLSPHELALPPKLKYLEINRHVFRLPIPPAKPPRAQDKPAPKGTKHDDTEPSLF